LDYFVDFSKSVDCFYSGNLIAACKCGAIAGGTDELACDY